jgi:tetratricopeptide (TPR) repeat protein
LPGGVFPAGPHVPEKRYRFLLGVTRAGKHPSGKRVFWAGSIRNTDCSYAIGDFMDRHPHLGRVAPLIAMVLSTPALGQDAEQRRAAMGQAFTALKELQPLLANPRDFIANIGTVEVDADVLAQIQHSMPLGALSDDPGLALTSAQLGDYLREAGYEAAARDYETARGHLATVTGFCLDCHARAGATVSLADIDEKVDALPIPPAQKADYLAATHQYDRALKLYDDLLSASPQTEAEALDFERALRHELNILVRMKGDSSAVIALLQKLEKRTGLPPALGDSIAQWRSDAEAWNADRFDPAKANIEKLLGHARRLMTGAVPPEQPRRRDDLRLMRAANELHAILRRGVEFEVRAESLYLLGICYSELEDPALGELDEFYWDICVRESPRTPMARKCYQRLFERIERRHAVSGESPTQYELENLADLRKRAIGK